MAKCLFCTIRPRCPRLASSALDAPFARFAPPALNNFWHPWPCKNEWTTLKYWAIQIPPLFLNISFFCHLIQMQIVPHQSSVCLKVSYHPILSELHWVLHINCHYKARAHGKTKEVGHKKIINSWKSHVNKIHNLLQSNSIIQTPHSIMGHSLWIGCWRFSKLEEKIHA